MTDNSPATELLPCPFCGGTDLKIWDNCVTCNSVECSASGPDLGHCTGAKCRDEAIKLWNIRAETAKNSGEVDEAYIDAYLDIILKASGSALRHYDFKDRLRKAMREVLTMAGGVK